MPAEFGTQAVIAAAVLALLAWWGASNLQRRIKALNGNRQRRCGSRWPKHAGLARTPPRHGSPSQ